VLTRAHLKANKEHMAFQHALKARAGQLQAAVEDAKGAIAAYNLLSDTKEQVRRDRGWPSTLAEIDCGGNGGAQAVTKSCMRAGVCTDGHRLVPLTHDDRQKLLLS
jgi:hypothetical protein